MLYPEAFFFKSPIPSSATRWKRNRRTELLSDLVTFSPNHPCPKWKLTIQAHFLRTTSLSLWGLNSLPDTFRNASYQGQPPWQHFELIGSSCNQTNSFPKLWSGSLQGELGLILGGSLSRWSRVKVLLLCSHLLSCSWHVETRLAHGCEAGRTSSLSVT